MFHYETVAYVLSYFILFIFLSVWDNNICDRLTRPSGHSPITHCFLVWHSDFCLQINPMWIFYKHKNSFDSFKHSVALSLSSVHACYRPFSLDIWDKSVDSGVYQNNCSSHGIHDTFGASGAIEKACWNRDILPRFYNFGINLVVKYPFLWHPQCESWSDLDLKAADVIFVHWSRFPHQQSHIFVLLQNYYHTTSWNLEIGGPLRKKGVVCVVLCLQISTHGLLE